VDQAREKPWFMLAGRVQPVQCLGGHEVPSIGQFLFPQDARPTLAFGRRRRLHPTPLVPPLMGSRVSHLLGELRRRKVFRVALAYAAVGVALVEAADLIFP